MAQAAFSYDVMLSDIETQIRKGNRRALRDLATLLDKPVYHDRAVLILETYTFFTKSEIDLEHTSRDQFMAFYFKNEEKLKYSEILRAFYVTPVEHQTYDFTVKMSADSADVDPSVFLRNSVLEFEKALKTGAKEVTFLKIIEKIAHLDTRDGYQWIRNTLNNTPFNKTQTDLYLALCEGLKNEPSGDNLNAILTASEKGLVTPELLSPALIELTNYAVTPQQAKQLRDSLESLEALRAFGYEQTLPFKEAFFYEKVDYYGKILSRKDTPWIQRNALRDLLLTNHPRLLFFIAAQLRLKPDERIFYEKTLKKLTKVQFSLPNTEGETVSEKGKITPAMLDDVEKYKDFVRYWANHAEDFKWDEGRVMFVNREELAQRTEQYEKLFRRLNSENDSVAMASFLQLTQGDPSVMAEMTDKFRPLLRTYNKNLPDIKFGYLEQMTRLVAFCRANNTEWQMTASLDSIVQILVETTNPQVRYSIENQLIKNIKIDDITSFEFKGCLLSGNQEMALSIGRILDFVYTKYWNSILSNDDQLRLYLKKSYLFKKIGVVGICNSYQNKIEKLDATFKKRLSDISHIEGDADVINQIQLLFGSENDRTTDTKSMLDVFLTETMSFVNSDLHVLPAPQPNDYQRIIAKIQSENERDILRLMLDYLDLHPSVSVVPNLFEIIGDDRRVKSTAIESAASESEAERVSDRVVILLEKIYGHSFAVADKRLVWRRFWLKDGKNYKEWDKQFFDEQVRYLTTADIVNIESLLEVSNSKYLNVKHKVLMVNALKKLQPFSDIRRFKCRLPFKASLDLKSFDTLKIAAKDFDDFIKVFEVDNDSMMWHFINKKAAAYSAEEAGSFYNSMFKVQWFSTAVSNEHISKYQKDLAVQVLTNYLSNSEILSDFEEQATLLHVTELQNVGRWLSEKLEASFALDVSEDARATIQEAILAHIGYAEIGMAAQYFDRLSRKTGYSPTSFLYKDFGLPVFNTSKEAILQLVENHKVMSQIDFYKFYLKQFGVDFMKENDELDFNKIYNILKYEIVAPFTGGGSQRDYFTFGIIKILELNFNNHLGFHEKLNENQMFYTFSATKRAVRWMQLLEERHLVKPDPSVPGSFNRLFAGN